MVLGGSGPHQTGSGPDIAGRAVIQPSVRASSAAISSGESVSAMTWLRNRAVSVGVKRSASPRTSTSWFRVRSRARGKGGSARLAMTRCTCGGK